MSILAGASQRAPSQFRVRALSLGVTALILLGIIVRFYHLDGRVFWDDEVIASLHIAGITEAELVGRAAGFHTLGDLRSVVHAHPATRPPAATIDALLREDPQHPPVYYLIARAWSGIFGDSRVALRCLSAVIGLIALPCMFWLCSELFESAVAAWAGVALLAISPVAVLYAQEVREYSLWLVLILVTSALFVRAVRRASPGAWAVYAAAVGISLYVFPASAFVVVAHAITILLAPATWRNRRLAIAAAGVGCLLFVPWLAIIVTHLDQINRGMATINSAHTSVAGVLRTFAGVVRLDILDLNGMYMFVVLLASVPIIGLLAYAVYAMRSAESALARALVWTLVVCSALPIVVPDLLFGGDRTSNVRYFVPLFVALDLALVALFVRKFDAFSARPRSVSSRVWAAVFAAVVLARVGSIALAAQSQTWWTDYNNHSIALAAVLDRADRPVILSDDYIVWALSLSEYADPTIRVALAPRCYLCSQSIPPSVDVAAALASRSIGSVFLLGPSRSLQRNVAVALRSRIDAPPSRCINVRDNCTSDLQLW